MFVIVPAEFLEAQEGQVWLRLIIMAALRVLYGLAGRRRVKETVFMLSEFAALGKLKAIEAARSQGRKYGVRLWPVLQDIHQLRDLYGPHGAEFLRRTVPGSVRVRALASGKVPSGCRADRAKKMCCPSAPVKATTGPA